MKEEAIGKLKSIEPPKRLKIFINGAIKSIKESLNEKFWKDDNHLIYTRKIGKKFFIKEHSAARYLERALEKKEIPEEQREIIKKVFKDLSKADEILANLSLNEAKNYQGQNKKITHYLKKAEDNLIEAKEYLEKEKYQRAILKFALSWEYS